MSKTTVIGVHVGQVGWDVWIEEDADKINQLFFFDGEELEDIYDDVRNNADTYQQVKGKMDAKFAPPVNYQLNIFELNSIAQGKGEPFSEFEKRLNA